ncbi:hypothetical protein ACQJBY_053833 [Aegilops geniculata]
MPVLTGTPHIHSPKYEADMGASGRVRHVGPDSPTPSQIAQNPPNPYSSLRPPSFLTPEFLSFATLVPYLHHRPQTDAVDVVTDRCDGDAVRLIRHCPFLGSVMQGREHRPEDAATPTVREGSGGSGAGRCGHGRATVSPIASGTPHPFPLSTGTDYAV